MKNNDVIRISNNQLFVQFLTTGEHKKSTVINLTKNVQFKVDDTNLAFTVAGQDQSIEVFSSEALAKTAYETLQEKLTKHFRNQSLFGIGKGVLKWVLLPLFILFFALALNGIVARALSSGSPFPMATAPMIGNNMPMIPSAAVPAPTPAAPAATAIPASELSKAMDDGVKADKFSVQLSSGKAGTLYVFSDPMCPHCRDIEPQLEKLAKDYTIHIFPVTIIGGTRSASIVSSVLCLPPEQRVAAWKKAIAGEPVGTASCGNGDKAFGANDQIFRAMQFPGTPQIIASNGATPGTDVEFTADGIATWYKSL